MMFEREQTTVLLTSQTRNALKRHCILRKIEMSSFVEEAILKALKESYAEEESPDVVTFSV